MMGKQSIGYAVIDPILRENGLESDDAFWFIANYYQRMSKTNCPDSCKGYIENITERYELIMEEKKISARISDQLGTEISQNDLANCYEYYIGRRFRSRTGKFFTPQRIATFMASCIPKNDDLVVFDPTCGGGTFLTEISERLSDCKATLIGNDVDSSLVALTELRISLANRDMHKFVSNSANLYKSSKFFDKWKSKVDYIIANPPFSLKIETIDFQSPMFNIGLKDSDMIFIDIAWSLLKQGGRMITLLPHSLSSNQDFSAFRKNVEQYWNILSIITLPEGTFHMTSNTSTRPDILILEKKDVSKEQEFNILLSNITTVGYKLNQRDKNVGDDLAELRNSIEFIKHLNLEALP
jgi:type I restriction-modification system DNA methylase subunit